MHGLMQGGTSTAMAAADERREADRDRMEKMAELRWGDQELKSTTCLLRNFSLRGLYLHAGESLREELSDGAAVSCKFHLPADLPSVGGLPVVCRGIVIRMEAAKDEPQTMGVAVQVDSILFV